MNRKKRNILLYFNSTLYFVEKRRGKKKYKDNFSSGYTRSRKEERRMNIRDIL